MEPVSKPSPFQGEKLQIDDLGNLSDIIPIIETKLSLAQRITAIEVDEKTVDGSESDANGNPPKISGADYERFGMEMSKIIDVIQQRNGLEKFRWTSVDDKNTRPYDFWVALWKAAGTLKSLNLEFSVHELAKLSELTLPSVDFPALTSLQIGAAAAHGDSGSLVERILQNSPAIQSLELSFPLCDLETCRIKGITWEYTFPSLRTLTVSTYNSDNIALSNFILRHPQIETLDWNVDADDVFVLPKNSLPDLREISIDFHNDNERARLDFETLAQCPHLARMSFRGPYASYLHIIKMRESLKYLSLDPGVIDWREGFEEPDEDEEERTAIWEAETGLRKLSDVVRKMLEGLHGLQEFDVDMETAYTFIRYIGGGSVNPNPMDDSDLKAMITLLPRNTQIRVLRMSDSRGLELSDELLGNCPDIPASLEVLKWHIGGNPEKEIVYRFERSNDRVRIVKEL